MNRDHRPLAVTLWIVLFLGSLAAGADPGPAPAKVIAGFNTALLEAMQQAQTLGYRGRYQLLAPAFAERFAMAFMARKSTGKSWTALSDDQRRLLIDLYTDWSVATYARRFDGFNGERFEIPADQPQAVRGTVTVTSRLIKSDGETVEFDYKLREMKGRWWILDIHIKGVSQLALTRSQFTSALERKGFDALIASLRDKIATLAREPEK